VEGHAMADNNAKITMDGKEVDLPIKTGTIGPDVVDIGTLYKNTGAFTYDPGFTSTASCESKITFIDGDEGILLHRGYPIDQLASMATSSRSATCFFTVSCRQRHRRQISITV
jgi:hypothetical protein